MATNPSLESLRRIISGAKADLTKLRAINSALAEKVAALRGRSQHYRPEFIEQEVGKLREEARTAVGAYVQRADPFGPFTSRVFGDGYWSVPAFLHRATITHDPVLISGNDQGNTTQIMKALLSMQRQTNLLLSLPRLPVDALAAVAETAHERQDWQTLAQVYSEASVRGTTDPAASALKNGILASRIDEVEEGKSLSNEAKILEEKLGYSLRAIRDGADDLGLKMEGYQEIAAQRRQEQQQSREQGRQSAAGTAGNSHDLPPAA